MLSPASQATPESASTPIVVPRQPSFDLSSLEPIYQHFIEAVASSLSVYLRSFVSGELVHIRKALFSEVAESVPNPTCVALLRISPYASHAIVRMDQCLIGTILDRVLCGNGKIKTEINRHITEVEQEMLDGVLRLVIRDLTQAWNNGIPVDFALDKIETNMRSFRRIGPSEAVVHTAIKVRIGEAVGELSVTMPVLALRAMRGELIRRELADKTASAEIGKAIENKLARELILEATCELHGASMRLRDVLGITPGKVIDLCVADDSSAVLVVGGTPKFRCVLQSEGPQFSASIRSAIPPAA